MSYDELYLDSNRKLHRLLFEDFLILEPYRNYDLFSLIDVYMQTSEIRRQMDKGDWRALNKCDKQLLNSIDLSLVKPKSKESVDMDGDFIPVWWMGEIYSLFQWMYDIPSKEISEKCPAEALYGVYNPLHETSHKNACEKIYHKFFGG